MIYNFIRQYMENKRNSIIDRIIVTGVEREYTPEEINAIEEELFSKELREHEELKAAGKLDEVEVPEGYEEEFDLEYNENEIQEDDPEVEELISNVFYGEAE
jgi:hypothetical protein